MGIQNGRLLVECCGRASQIASLPFDVRTFSILAYDESRPTELHNTVGQAIGRIILALNPMYGLITAWRKMLLSGAPDDVTGWNPWYFATSILVTAGLFVLGLFYFRRTERRFADIA